MMLEIPSREYDALIPKQIQIINRLSWPSDVKFEMFVDVAEPESIRSEMRQLNCVVERSLKNEGGDIYFVLNGHLAEVIERKAGMDLMASLNKGSKDDIRFGKERFNSQISKLTRLPVRRITLWSEHKKVSVQSMKHINIPQLAGAVATTYINYRFSHFTTMSIHETIYQWMKMVKKVNDSLRSYISCTLYFAKFDVFLELQRVAQSFAALALKVGPSADKAARITNEPLNIKWCLTDDEMHQLQAYEVRKPQQKTPKLILLYMMQVLLSEAMSLTIAPHFDSWGHLVDYMRETDRQEVMDFLARLPLLKVNKSSRGVLPSRTPVASSASVATLVSPASSTSSGDDEDDNDAVIQGEPEDDDDDNDDNDDNEEDAQSSSMTRTVSKTVKKRTTGGRCVGPDAVKKMYLFWLEEVITVKKARTDKQIAKHNKTRADFAPSATLRKNKPGGKRTAKRDDVEDDDEYDGLNSEEEEFMREVNKSVKGRRTTSKAASAASTVASFTTVRDKRIKIMPPKHSGTDTTTSL